MWPISPGGALLNLRSRRAYAVGCRNSGSTTDNARSCSRDPAARRRVHGLIEVAREHGSCQVIRQDMDFSSAPWRCRKGRKSVQRTSTISQRAVEIGQPEPAQAVRVSVTRLAWRPGPDPLVLRPQEQARRDHSGRCRRAGELSRLRHLGAPDPRATWRVQPATRHVQRGRVMRRSRAPRAREQVQGLDPRTRQRGTSCCSARQPAHRPDPARSAPAR
jgi:hypothetical protein